MFYVESCSALNITASTSCECQQKPYVAMMSHSHSQVRSLDVFPAHSAARLAKRRANSDVRRVVFVRASSSQQRDSNLTRRGISRRNADHFNAAAYCTAWRINKQADMGQQQSTTAPADTPAEGSGESVRNARLLRTHNLQNKA